MNPNFKIKGSAQGGFTLIELIVVIVILGILAATALPKFANLGGDARVASLNGVRGSLNSAAAMVHGKVLVTSPAPGTVTVEGVAVNVVAASGYPAADTKTAEAAGIVSGVDFTVYGANTAGSTTIPTTGANTIAIVPTSIVGTTSAPTCFVSYTAPTTANTAPTITVTATAANCGG